MTRAIAARAARVTAIDVAPTMLAIATEQNPDLSNVDWLLGDGVSLGSLPDASADACVSFVVLQHIPDPEVTLGYIREMGRVLRPGGWSVFQVSHKPEVPRRRRNGPRRRLASRRGHMPKGQTDPACLGSWIKLDDLRATSAQADLVLENVEGEGTQFCMVLARRAAA